MLAITKCLINGFVLIIFYCVQIKFLHEYKPLDQAAKYTSEEKKMCKVKMFFPDFLLI